MSDINIFDMDELPPVRTFIDGELVNVDADMQAMTPINQIPKQRGFAINMFDEADEATAAARVAPISEA